jgi:glycosyltransferase involved in cell wall biosynthesis
VTAELPVAPLAPRTTPSLKPRLIVISHACSRAVNRRAYVELVRLGWYVQLITAISLPLNGTLLASDPAEDDGIDVKFLPLIGENSRTYYFDGLLSALAPDADWVICDNDPQSKMGVLLARHKARLGYRLGFISCENLNFGWRALLARRGLRGLALAGFLSVCRLQVRRQTDLVWVINDAGLRLFQNVGFKRVVKTPLGFPDALFQRDQSVRDEIRAKFPDQDQAIVAYFGRLTVEKGVHLLLDALESSTLMQRQWRLLIDHFQAVDHYQKQLLQRLQHPRWSGRVSWIHAKHGEVARYMNAADVVVLPSISTPQWVEQYGRVAPEAMACGCVVLAARSGALPELVGDAGFLVPEGDVAALTRCLTDVLEQLPAAELRSYAAARAQALLSASSQAQLWDKVLRE